ncbi:MAG: BamA/TamA family outer membrane protein [Bacteroidetes bacterium]|nr:BamA/TamA family outer membrane protein [Bacteroidota bacterium]
MLSLSCLAFAQEDDEPVLSKMKVSGADIEFKGNNAIDKSRIASIIKTGNSDYFSSEDFVMDIKRIEKFYFDNGYFDAFVDTATSVSSDAEIDVKFIITENAPYIIGEINYFGLETLSQGVRKDIFAEGKTEINKGDVYNKTGVSSEAARITKYLQNNGYAFAYVNNPEIVRYQTKNPELAHKVKVDFYYNVGGSYRFGYTKVKIANNKYGLQLEDILDELEYVENDIYSKEKIIMSENRLNRMNILENPRILIDHIDTVNNIIYPQINTSLTNKYELQPELLGYDIDNSFFAGLGLSFMDKYFMGNARTLKTGIRGLANSVDTYRMELSAELQQPHIFKNNKITGNWNLSYVLYSFNEFRVGIAKNKFTINYELPKHTYINNLTFDWKLTNERFVLKENLSDSTGGTAILPSGFTTNFLNSALGMTVIHNSIDNFQFPTQGFFQTYYIEECGLLSSLIKTLFTVQTINYVKGSFLNKFYVPVTSNPQKSTFASKFLAGIIYQYNSEANNTPTINFLPLDYKFIAGGSTSVRGWGARKLGTFPEKDVGGNFIIEGSFEHRTRPFLDSKGLIRDLGFVTFLDYGNLWDDVKHFRFNDVALAIGAGLRYYTIVGPVRFDLGFKLYDYDPADGTAKWLYKNNASNILSKKLTIQFGIGNTF